MIINYFLNFINNSKFKIHNFLTLIILLLIVACSTEPQTGSLSGTINLEGQQDHSGITVAVYNLAELDQDIVEINEEYPFIGVKISQTTEFDHRFGNLIKYTHTDANGNFKIKNIPTGRYNVVAIKEGFGFKYIYEISITEGDNDISNVECLILNSQLNSKFKIQNSKFISNTSSRNSADITLYPESYINADINEETVFETDHHYIIEEDIFVLGSLTIEPGAVIRLNEGVKLIISGDLTAIGEEENMIWFTSNDGLDSLISLYPYTPYTFHRVELTASEAKQVSWCKFDHAGTGLLSKVNGFSISDCIFRNSSCGFKSENVDSTFCSNLLCKTITNESYAGIYFNQVADGCIEKNVIINCENGMKIKTYSNPEVKNNYFDNCNTGIDISFYSNPLIKFNEIENCYYGLKTLENTNIILEMNNIFTQIGLKVEIRSQTNIVSNNNIKSLNYSIKLDKWTADVSAENNYFYTTNNTIIEELIYDKNDVEPSQQQLYGEVAYEPFLIQEYSYAGIQSQ
ncbi:MAG: right-handed parallel beta-helix repeat-containing protein [Candidatus Cloacimonetes bacterium]|nr:right-handed parallel beta-helix repeat-containing protein [Candidatus Cloacimonadota bacterium]